MGRSSFFHKVGIKKDALPPIKRQSAIRTLRYHSRCRPFPGRPLNDAIAGITRPRLLAPKGALGRQLPGDDPAPRPAASHQTGGSLQGFWTEILSCSAPFPGRKHPSGRYQAILAYSSAFSPLCQGGNGREGDGFPLYNP